MPGFDEKCKCINDGNSIGKLFCPSKEIECRDGPHDKNTLDPKANEGNYECKDGKKIRQSVFLYEY